MARSTPATDRTVCVPPHPTRPQSIVHGRHPTHLHIWGGHYWLHSGRALRNMCRQSAGARTAAWHGRDSGLALILLMLQYGRILVPVVSKQAYELTRVWPCMAVNTQASKPANAWAMASTQDIKLHSSPTDHRKTSLIVCQTPWNLLRMGR